MGVDVRWLRGLRGEGRGGIWVVGEELGVTDPAVGGGRQRGGEEDVLCIEYFWKKYGYT